MKSKFTFLIFLFIVETFGFTLAGQNIPRPNIYGPNGFQVNTYTGNLFYQRSDIFIPGRGLDIDLTFTYNSGSRNKDYGFGKGWTFMYNMAYSINADTVVIEQSDGRTDTFNLVNSTYQPPTGIFDQLEEYQTGQFSLTSKTGMKYFFDNNSHKRLTKMEDRYGNMMTFTYADTLLQSLTDPSGRTIEFTWTGNRLTKITDPNTNPTRYINLEYDSEGNPIKITNPLGDFVEYYYDDDHKMTAMVDENGVPVNFEYNFQGAIKKMITCVSEIKFTYNSGVYSTYVVQEVSGEHQMTAYQYDESGRLVEKKGNCCGYNIKYEYDEDNNISQMTDANGSIYSYLYDDNGNMTQMTDPLGNSELIDYEPVFNNITCVTDKNGNSTTYEYDANGNLIKVNKPLGVTNEFIYDLFGQIITSIDGNGNSIDMEYDIFGYLKKVIDQENNETVFQYDGVGNRLSITDGKGIVSKINWDLNDRLTELIDGNENHTYYEYDEKGNAVKIIDGNGIPMLLIYDGLGRLIGATDPKGNQEIIGYDEIGNITSTTNRNGFTSTLEYDSRNRLIKFTNPLQEVIEYKYDNNGNMVKNILPNGNIREFIYDQLNRIVEISDLLGASSKVEYDNNSNVKGITDGLGRKISYSVDALDRLIEYSTEGGRVTSFTFDKNDNLLESKINGEINKSFTYSYRDFPLTEIDAVGNVSEYFYDQVGNLIEIQDKNLNITKFEYDGNSNKIKTILPNGLIKENFYDGVNNLVKQINEANQSIYYEYDSLNQLNQVIYPDDTLLFNYDNVGNLINASNESFILGFAYDASNRTISETKDGKSVLFNYSISNKSIDVLYPSGKAIKKEFDFRNNLISVNQDLEELVTLSYDLNNNLESKSFSNNTYSDYTYDVTGQISKIQHASISPMEFKYVYDLSETLIEETNEGLNQKTIYEYDGLEQLKSYLTTNIQNNSTVNEEIYTYDNLGNRLTGLVDGANKEYISNSYNQYSKIIESGNETLLDYDIQGNLKSFNGFEYLYSTDGFLKNVIDPNGDTITYQYDPLGRLGRRIFKGAIEEYFYEGENIIEIYDGNGSLIESNIFGQFLNQLLVKEKNSQKYFFQSDRLGSTVGITNEAGKLIEKYSYSAFGEVMIQDENDLILDKSELNRHLFTGYYIDYDANIYLAGLRGYSSALGRFLQPDPLEYVDGMNLFSYVLNNPINYIDPTGTRLVNCHTKEENELFRRQQTKRQIDQDLQKVSMLLDYISEVGDALTYMGGILATLSIIPGAQGLLIPSAILAGVGQAISLSTKIVKYTLFPLVRLASGDIKGAATEVKDIFKDRIIDNLKGKLINKSLKELKLEKVQDHIDVDKTLEYTKKVIDYEIEKDNKKRLEKANKKRNQTLRPADYDPDAGKLFPVRPPLT